MIVDAVLPLLMDHGPGVTSRQIAEAAGVAEGTIFRAFGDKETLLRAAVTRCLDPEPLLTELDAIDPTWPLDTKVRAVLVALRRRFTGVFRVMSTLSEKERPVPTSVSREIAERVATALAPEAGDLHWNPAQIAQLIRLIAFSSAFPALTVGSEFSDDELTGLLMHGITGTGTNEDTHAR